VTGNVTGNYILGNGALLTGVITSVANINSGTSNVTVVSSGGNITVGIAGTSNVAVFASSGEYVTGLISATGNITGGNLSGTSIVGTLTTAAQTNITSVGTLGSLAVTGNITGGNINTLGVGTFGNATPSAKLHVEQGSGSNIAYFRGNNASVNSKVTLETTSNTSSIGMTLINSGVGVAKQASFYLTSTGAIQFQTNQIVGGEPTTGNAALIINTDSSITVNSGAAATAIVNGATTGTGNIGASGAAFNTVFAKATTAQYADLAEMYAADADYAPGTVVDFGGTQEITISTTPGSDRIAGVVSTDPAHLMNSTQSGDHVIAVALTGRVPTRVTGTVWKGAMMISAGNGHARACATPAIGTVIGKSLEDFSGDSGTIHVVVGRL
jgi:hypothetical protein